MTADPKGVIVLRKTWGTTAFGLFYVDPNSQLPLIRQACFLLLPGGEVAFTEKATEDRALGLTFERQFCEMAMAAQVDVLWAHCPSRLAEHYERTYPGWRITSTWTDPQLGLMARVEKDLTAWEV